MNASSVSPLSPLSGPTESQPAAFELLPPESPADAFSGPGNLSGLAAVLDCLPDWVMILDEHRQVLFANRTLRAAPASRVGARLLGAPPSQVPDQPAAVTLTASDILGALGGSEQLQAGQIRNVTVDVHDFRIWANPFRWLSGHYILVIAAEVSNERRCRDLEKIFFHDLLNTAANIHGLSELIRSDPSSLAEFKDDLHETAEELVNEIHSQRLLLSAERNELQVTLVPASSRDLLESIIQTYRHHPLASGKTLRVFAGSGAFMFRTDKTLMLRTLGNLVKNALEASKPGDVVELGSAERSDCFVFWCHNPQPIPSAIQATLFRGDFSSKGASRGIGTYSVRLLTERYLGGKVTVKSAPGTGTRFELTFPKDSGPSRPELAEVGRQA